LEGGEAEWSGGSNVSVETGSRWWRMEGGADEGAARSGGGEWRGMRFITNMDGENGDGGDSLQTANTTEGSCQNGTSNNYKK
jgi:hypothetical protein